MNTNMKELEWTRQYLEGLKRPLVTMRQMLQNEARFDDNTGD